MAKVLISVTLNPMMFGGLCIFLFVRLIGNGVRIVEGSDNIFFPPKIPF